MTDPRMSTSGYRMTEASMLPAAKNGKWIFIAGGAYGASIAMEMNWPWTE